jgi:hypothetical protein
MPLLSAAIYYRVPRHCPLFNTTLRRSVIFSGQEVVITLTEPFGAAAGAVTLWVTAGAAFAEPHAARLIPAANAMAGIAIALLSFIVLPSPQTILSESLSAMPRRASRSTIS